MDLRGSLLTVQATYAKGGGKGVVPTSSRLREALRRQMKRSKSGWVSVRGDGISPYKSIRTAFETACRRAQLSDITPNVLRKNFQDV